MIDRHLHIACLICFLSLHVKAQSFLIPADTFVNSRFYLVAGTGAIIYGSTVIGLNQVWYKDFEKTSFHLFDDRGEWQNMDKMGHLFTTYFETELSYQGSRWTGMNEQNAIWLASGLGLFYQSTIEMFDAYSSRWGFSIPDMIYNVAGAALFAGQQFAWSDQRIRMKVSSWPKQYPAIQLNSDDMERESSIKKRTNDLFGTGFFERYLKDYNAQTIWMSINPNAFFPTSSLPPWLNIAIGYGSDNLYGGFSNSWLEENSSFTLSEQDFPRTRQFYISPDIDFKRIKTNKPFLQTVFSVLNIFKIPAPAIEYNSQGKLKWHWIFL